MTKRIYFLVLVLTIINSALYAFSNPYFSASERGWSVERESDENLTFEINSYTPSEEEEEFLPKISIVENVPGILNAKIYVGQEDDELRQEITELWTELENYKGRKSALRKVNQVSSEFEEEGKKLRDRKKWN